MNKVILSGGVTKDAELNFLTTGTPKMMFNQQQRETIKKIRIITQLIL